MNIVDANVLLSAVNDDSDDHAAARAWLDGSLSGGQFVGFSWIVMVAFMRVATRPRLFSRPLSVDEGLDRVERWIAAPSAMVVEPTPRHLSLVRSLLAPLGTGGNLVNDAHLAALSIEHRGSVVSFDTDFALFQGITWHRPTR